MWTQLNITTSPDYADLVADTLQQLGAAAVTMADGADEALFQLEPGHNPLWQETKLTALFVNPIEPKHIITKINDVLEKEIVLEYQVETLEDQDWVKQTQQNFPPLCFADTLWVLPSWYDEEQPECSIRIDPGLAFGTGTHPTTALCIEWLCQNPPVDLTVIDYGCGSGILSLAALKLGAKKVIAIDHDPQALEATNNNAQLNIELTKNKLDMVCTSDNETTQTETAPLILANILSNPLVELAPLISELADDNATLLLSGLLKEETDKVAEAYQPLFTVVSVDTKEEWARLVLKSNDIISEKKAG